MSMNLNDLKWITGDGFERELSGNSGVVLGADAHPAASWTGSASNPQWTEYPNPGAVVIGNGCYIDARDSKSSVPGVVIGNSIAGAAYGVMIGSRLSAGNTVGNPAAPYTVSIGSNNYSHESSVSIGRDAFSYIQGVAIGEGARAEATGVAIGGGSENTKPNDITIGYNPVRFFWSFFPNQDIGYGSDYNARGNNVFISAGTTFSIGNSKSNIPSHEGDACKFLGISNSVIVGNCQVTEGSATYNCLLPSGGAFSGLTFLGENQRATLPTEVYIGVDKTALDGLQNLTLVGYGAHASEGNAVVLGDEHVNHLYCNTQTISSLSDSRVKEEVELADIDRCLADVQRLPVSRYKYKDFTGSHIDKHVTGFMADDVEKVFPKSVFATDETFNELDEDGEQVYELRKDAKGEPVLDDDGHPILDKKTFTLKDVKKIAINDAIPTLWGAVQALAKRVEVLEAEIATLKGNQASEAETTTETSVSE